MSFLRDPHKNKWIGNRFAFFAAWLSVLLFMARRRIVAINYRENSDDDMRFYEFYCNVNVFSHAPSPSLSTCDRKRCNLFSFKWKKSVYRRRYQKVSYCFLFLFQLCFLPSFVWASLRISMALQHVIQNREKQLQGRSGNPDDCRERTSAKKRIQLKNK